MRHGRDFDTAVKRGRRSGRRTVVMHVATMGVVAAPTSGAAIMSATPPPAQVGFVVSKAVGSAVVRNRVKRRLLADRLDRIPPGVLVVVRANPASASVSSRELAADLDVVLPRALQALVPRDELESGRLTPAGGEQ